MPDHVHMCIAIPPQHPVASGIGFLRGKSAMAIARLSAKNETLQASISGLGATRYPAWASSFELEQVRQYIREQEAADGNHESFCS